MLKADDIYVIHVTNTLNRQNLGKGSKKKYGFHGGWQQWGTSVVGGNYGWEQIMGPVGGSGGWLSEKN